MQKPLAGITCVLLLSACIESDTHTPIAATHPSIVTSTDTSAPSFTLEPTSVVDPIDARLTSIAQTVHPQLTSGMNPSMSGTATAQARLTTSTPTLPNTLVMPFIESAQVRLGAWSPDGKWISFWINSQSPDDPEYFLINVMPAYYEVATGRICTYEQFAGSMQMEYPNTYDYWMEDGDSVIVSGGTPYVGKPCEDFIRAPDSFAGGKWGWADSPDGKYRAETSYKAEPPIAITTITSIATGEVIDQIEWTHGGGQWVLAGVFARWLDNNLLFFGKTYDRGPLLVEVGGEQIEILTAFFGVEPTPNLLERTSASVAIHHQSGQLHMMLDRDGEGTSYLYHPESREVEELPFHYVWFSPNGRWLLMTTPTTSPNDYSGLWIRAVDPVQSADVFFGRVGGSLTWSDLGDRVAYQESFLNGQFGDGVIVATFPQNNILYDYRHPDYNLWAMEWSPDGTKLLVQGYLKVYDPKTQGMALFIVEP